MGGKGGKELRLGSRGKKVTEVQAALKRAGFFHEKTTGYFGPVTKKALIEFQRSKGLIADGIVGSQTRKALSPYDHATKIVSFDKQG